MARGLQKLQSQQKTNEKNSKMNKGSTSQKGTAAAGLLVSCVVCKAQLPDNKTYRQHFDNKHPKATVPDDIKDVTYVA